MRPFAVLSILPLAACAADNPENTPLRGNWEMSTEVTSLSVGGRYMAGDQLPREFRALEETVSRCGEPMFIDKDWQQSDIDRRVRADCTLETYDWTPAQVISSGRCRNVEGADDFTPAVRVAVDQTADYFRMVVTMEGSASIRGAPGRPMISVIAVQEGRRTGDC